MTTANATATAPHWIKIRLTVEAQKIALLAGLPAQSEQVYPVELADVPALIRIGGRIDDNGVVTFTAMQYVAVRDDLNGMLCWSDNSYSWSDMIEFGALGQRPESGADAISMIEARIDSVRTEHERRRIAKVASENERIAVVAESERLQREQSAAYASKRAESDRSIADLCAKHGTESQRERLAEETSAARPFGVLPTDEALEIVRNHMLPLDPARGLVPYWNLNPSDVEHADECDADHERISYHAVDATTLDADEWATVKCIRAALDAANIASTDGVVRRHIAECRERDCPSVGASRIGILVERRLDEYREISREYGEPAGDIATDIRRADTAAK